MRICLSITLCLCTLACNGVLENESIIYAGRKEIIYTFPRNEHIVDLAAAPLEDQILYICRKEMNTGKDEYQIRYFSVDIPAKHKTLYLSKNEITNIRWSSCGQLFLFLQDNYVYLYNINTGAIHKTPLPIESSNLVRWTENDSLIICLSSVQDNQNLYTLNIAIDTFKHIDIQPRVKLVDFTLIPGRHKIYAAGRGNDRLMTFQTSTNQIHLQKSIELDVKNLIHAPKRSALAQNIGPYLLIKGEQNFGIFFPEKEIISWLQHLKSDDINCADWRFDGNHLYYLISDDNTLYVEQVLFP